jgi:hypothetical protein
MVQYITYTMEQILQAISQHLISFFNLSLMKLINTGDRMLDTTIQLLFSTIIGGVITGLVTVYTKGLWKDTYNKMRAVFSKTSYDPLEFDPSLAPEKPKNGTMYLYKYLLTDMNVFYSWFITHHSSKIYTQKLKSSLTFPSPHIKKNIMDLDMIPFENIESTCFDICIPIWRHHNGMYVYVKNNNDIYVISSDSGDALNEFGIHYATHKNKMIDITHSKDEVYKVNVLYQINSQIEKEHIGQISENKVFDTLFFTEKKTVLPIITAFKNNTLYPKHLPIDNKLGIILHGPPGTGKTGFISALANYLERNVILVHMSHLKTRKDLDLLFAINKATKYIYVFEEFDCTLCTVNRATVEPVTKEHKDYKGYKDDVAQNMAYTMMLMSQKDKSESIVDSFKRERALEDDKLDLAYLLTKLDGIESAEGRIIIATTNYPERIDSALLRPGRFGIQLKLTNCTHEMLVDIIAMVYQYDQEKKEDLRMQVEGIDENVWSPAEILQLAITKKSADELLDHLLLAKLAQMTSEIQIPISK